MFKQFSKRLNIAMPKFLAALLIGLLLPPISGIAETKFLTSANALTAPTTGGAYFNPTKPTYLTVSASSNFQFSTSDNFTIAWWQYAKNDTSWPRTWSIGNGSNSLAVSQEGGVFYLWRVGSWSSTSFAQTTTLDTWVHYAVVRASGTLKIYENGKQKISVANTQAFGDNTNAIYIGTNLGYPADQRNVNFGGYLTGFEIIKGNAKYSGSSTSAENFVVPNTYSNYTTSVTSGTKLLFFPTSNSNLTTDLSGSGAGYTITNTSGASYNSVTYSDPGLTPRTVTFNVNSGSGSPSSASITGNPITLATVNTLSRSGYTFSGWNTASDGSGTNYLAGSSYSPTANITLYAQWNSYIQYIANGASSGSPPDSTTAKSSAAVTTLATNSRSLAREGFTFGGWNTNETGTGTSYTLPKTDYASTGNSTLYARWDSVITYLGNLNSSGSVPSALNMTGTAGTLATNTGTLVKTVSGKTFTFGGWNTNETGTGTTYAAGASYISTGSRSLYAQWNTVVTYNGNSNSAGSAPSATTITGASGTLATNSGNLQFSGKVLAGWNTNSAGTGTRYALGATFPNSGNITLFAQWVNVLTLTGSSSISVAQGSAFRSESYTATNGLETKTVNYSLSPSNVGITLETSTVGTTTYAYIRVAATVAGGTYIDTLTATDAMGTTATLAVTVRVDSPIRWSAANSSSITSTYGQAASLRIDTTNGFSNRVYTLTHMSSPTSSGITLDTSTAVSQYVTLNVSSSVAPGTYIESVTATDSSGTRISVSITVIVNQPIIVSKDGSIVASTFGSMQFNGSSNYVTYTGAASSLQIGNTYTIEWWQYQTDNSSWPRIFSAGGNNFGVSIESNLFYYWTTTPNLMGTSNSNRKNKWTHFALVSNVGNMMVYQDGIALSASSIAVTALNTSTVPNGSTLCIASQCGNSGTFFGGNLTNFMISSRADYSGANISSANFTPSTQMRIESTTVIALSNFIGSNTFVDLSSSARTAANYFSSIGSVMNPGVSAANLVDVITTQGTSVTSSAFTATNGSGNKSFAMTSNYAPASVAGSTNSATVSISGAATATSSSVARTAFETLTVTDTASATLRVPLKLTINPPVSLSATTLTLTTSAGVAAYDTVTATFGTGTKSFSVTSSSPGAGITYSSPLTNTYLMTVSKTVPQGTYYETITATDSVGSTTSVVITVTVAPGLSLVSATGINTLQTTFGRAASLRLNAQNGSGTKTFTLTQIGVSSAGITLDVSTAASGYATLNIANNVVVGSYTDSITVTDTSGGRFSISISVSVNAAQTLSYDGVTSGTVALATTTGRALRSNAFTAALGTGTRTLSISGRNAAISIDTSTANVGYLNLGSGLSAGTYFETVTVTDAVGATTLRSITVTVNPAITLTATPTSLTITSGVSITDTVTAANGTGNKTFSVSVTPSVAGITFTNTVLNRAVITVANTVSPGSYTITLTATDSVSASTSVDISLLVNSSLVINGPVALSSTAGYTFTSPTYSSSGGSGNQVFSLSGAIGVRLSSSTGIPSIIVPDTITAGTYNLTLRVTDSVTATSTQAVTLNVNAPVSLNGNKTLTKVYGEELTQVYQTNSGTAPFNVFASNICTSEKSTYIADGTNGISGQSYTVEKFNGVGTCNWVAPTSVDSATILVVAGGGGGGSRHAGGGGGGGVLYATNYSLTPGSSYSLSTGNGGAGAPGGASSGLGSVGQNSYFGGASGATSIVANGGGSTNTGGGSGGGSNYDLSAAGSASPGSAADSARSAGTSTMTVNGRVATVQAYGRAGAVGLGNACRTIGNSNGWCGGGGGGASGAGSSPAVYSGSQYRAGKGGDGVEINITGSTVRYAGGGGGGAGSDLNTYTNDSQCIADSAIGGAAGLGGGGAGSTCRTSATRGTANLGGGGGGGGYSYLTIGGNQNATGGNGGSGTVIVRYLTPAADSSTSILTMTTLTTNPTGSLQLNAPRNLPVLAGGASYTQTVTVTDASGSTGSTPVNIVLTVTKATPVLTLAIPGGGTAVTYGSPVSLTATATTPGAFNFKKGGTSISGCSSKSTVSGQVTCSWTPTDTSTAVISADFTPTDTTNYNTVSSSNLTLTVLQADTLTVTFNSQSLTYTGSAASISRSYSLSGLTSIDSITAVTTLITGTANDSSAYSSATSPTKAGSYSLTGTAVTFSGSNKTNFYRSIVYVQGNITIERASNVITFNYGTGNTVTYRPTGVETVTASYLGDGALTFSTSDTVYCSLNPSNGNLTTVQAGSCDISLGVSQGTSYLGDTVTATVTINKAPRAITLTSSASSLKYGETATVTTSVNFAALDGVISYSGGVTTGCSFDPTLGLLTATSGTATCSVIAAITSGVNYQSATSSTLTVTLNKADAPVVTLISPTNVDYSPTAVSADMAKPSFTIAGLKFSDTATAISAMTITYVATGTYSYNSSTVPTGANNYTLTPSALILSVGSLNNYQTPSFLTSSWTINKITQSPLRAISLLQEGVTVPFDIQYSGGTTNGAVTLAISPGGTATGCARSGLNLQASSTGTCVIQLTMAGNQNYLEVVSETITVTIANFVQSTFDFNNLGPSTGITISSLIPITVDAVTCSTDCVPTISGISPTAFQAGDLIVISGTDFAGATEIIFNRNVFVTSLQIDSNDQITVLVPSGLTLSANGSISVKNGSKISNRISGLSIIG